MRPYIIEILNDERLSVAGALLAVALYSIGEARDAVRRAALRRLAGRSSVVLNARIVTSTGMIYFRGNQPYLDRCKIVEEE